MTTTEHSPPNFDGATYQPELDGERLTNQLERVRAAMAAGSWWTIPALAAEVHGSQASVSARIRDLRKPRHGGHLVERQRDPSDMSSGLWLYRLGAKGHYTDEHPSGEPGPVPDAPKGLDLVERWGGRAGHAVARACPHCGGDMTQVGLPSIAYTFEVCDCGTPTYRHLVEQLWHRSCLRTHEGHQ